MATKKKKSSKKASANANMNAEANMGGTKSSAKATFNFADMQKFMNPTQFMNQFANLQNNFQTGNMQQMVEQIMQTGQKNIETMTACTQIAMERAKEVMEEQASFANRLMQETTSTFQEAFTSGNDPKDKMEEIADYAKYCMEKGATHARKVAEENAQVAQKISSALSKRVSETIEEIRSAA